jgi:hypothetical protein
MAALWVVRRKEDFYIAGNYFYLKSIRGMELFEERAVQRSW